MYSDRELKADALARALGQAHVPAGIPQGAEWERRASVRQASLRADVGVPLAQALVSGLLVGILGILALGIEAGALAGVVVTAGVWALLLFDHVSQLWESESLVAGEAGQDAPSAPQRLVKVEVASDDGRSMRWLDLPIDEGKLVSVARALLAQGVSFSRPGLCGAGILTQGEYAKLVSALLEAGLAVEGPGNKRELNAGGRALFRALLTADD